MRFHLRSLLALVFALAAGHASACGFFCLVSTATGSSSATVTNGGTEGSGQGTPAYAQNGANTTVSQTSQLKVGDANLVLTAQSQVTPSALSAAYSTWANCVTASCSAMAIYRWLSGARIYPNGQGGWSYDQGQPPQAISGRVYKNDKGDPGIYPYSSAQAACTAELPAQTVSSGNGLTNVVTWSDAVADSYSDGTSGGCTATKTSSCSADANHAGFCGPSPTTVQTGQGIGYWNSTISQSSNFCPATTDALNPAYSTAAGTPPGPDGLCPTGRYTAATQAQAAARAAQYGNPSAMPDAVAEVANAGQPIATPAPSVTGPATSAGPTKQTTETPAPTPSNPNPAPVTTTTNTTNNYTYNTNNISWTTTNTTTLPDGTVKTETVDPQPVCGLPGKPECAVKVDEAGTPAYVAPSTKPIDDLKTTDASSMTAASASIVDPGFGWIDAPPIVQCTPFAWPGGFSLDPCGPMEQVRGIMAYIWALAAFWLCMGMIKKAVTGG